LIYNLLCSLQFIHHANIIHRDLKPQNILVDGNSGLRLSDFGFSRCSLKREGEEYNIEPIKKA